MGRKKKEAREKERAERKSLYVKVVDRADWVEEPAAPAEPRIGDRRVFIPSYLTETNCGGMTFVNTLHVREVTWTVVYVHRAHRWLRCRYFRPDGSEAFECFKY